MSFLLDKLAAANPRTSHPFAAFGQPVVCRLCDCDDDHPCITADSSLRASGLDGEARSRASSDALSASAQLINTPCSWFLIDLAYPSGICSACAARVGWHSFFMVADGFEPGQQAA